MSIYEVRSATSCRVNARHHYVAVCALNLDGLVVADVHDLQKVPPAIARFVILLDLLQMIEQSFCSLRNKVVAGLPKSRGDSRS